ncbi:MAG: winged helix-turn-helix transcriptional regulator [Acidobacteria bacterium]|nr:winged helix-turn-helix transcriptional regulator [Acidobacteriota bacterium]
MAYGDALAALADPTRRAVFEKLRQRPRTVGELASELPVSQPAVSQHLRRLREAHLVEERREGTRRYYRVSAIGLNELRDYLDGFWGDVLSAFAAGGERGSDDGERDSAAREDGERGLGTRGRVPKVHRRDVGLVAARKPLHRPGKRRRVRV